MGLRRPCPRSMRWRRCWTTITCSTRPAPNCSAISVATSELEQHWRVRSSSRRIPPSAPCCSVAWADSVSGSLPRAGHRSTMHDVVLQRRLDVVPQGPFDLETEAGHFGGWPRLGDAIVMTFPVEGWRSSAAVLMRQRGDTITGDVHGGGEADAERAWRQALATVSLDVDGQGFIDIGRRDPVVRRLQAEYKYLRPVLFHSPYEAACAFVIGHRITILQTRRIRQRMADQAGAAIEVDGTAFKAFPDPRALLQLESFPSVAPAKIDRLRHVARAALEGTLDRARLGSLPEPEALTQLRTLP